MPRRGTVVRRERAPDPKYGDTQIARFISVVMRQGKKCVAEGIMYGALDIIRDRHREDPVETFRKAMANVQPRLEVRSRRVGGATYQVPVEVRGERQVALAMRWLSQYARARGEKTMREKLAAELVDAAAGRGSSVKKREDTYRMAEANKAFAHYKW